MKRLEVLYNRSAETDLYALEEWLLGQGVGFGVIDGYLARLRGRCDRIGDLPHSGFARDDLLPGLRIVNFEKRVIVGYLVRDAYVEILNFFSHGRDYEAFYTGDDRW